MDGWTGGWMDGQTDGQTDGVKVRGTHERDNQTNERTNGRTEALEMNESVKRNRLAEIGKKIGTIKSKDRNVG